LAGNKEKLFLKALDPARILIATPDSPVYESGVVTEERAYLIAQLGKLDIKCYPSETNFFLAYFPQAEESCAFLERRSIRLYSCKDIRGLGEGFCEDSCREPQNKCRAGKGAERVQGCLIRVCV